MTLLVKSGSRYHCYEIKSGETFHPDFIKGLANFKRSFGELTADMTVIYAGEASEYNGVGIANYRSLPSLRQ